VPDKTHKTIRIKWVRSGIGFPHRQKTIVRSLGLKRLNQTVVRPDTPQIRGIVAAVPHLLAIVPDIPTPAWASVAEYAVRPAEVAPAPAAEETAEVVGVEAASEAVASPTAAQKGEPEAGEPLKPAKAARKKAEKAPAKAAAKKVKAAPAAETKPKAATKRESPKKESKTAKASKK
jgi:large subunit ribosomal protein L30